MGQKAADDTGYLTEEDGEAYRDQFSQHVGNSIPAPQAEALGEKAQAAVRESRVYGKSPRKKLNGGAAQHISCSQDRLGSLEEGTLPENSGTGCRELIN